MRSQLYRSSALVKSYGWQTLPQHFLGAGSTFAAAIAAGIAHGVSTDSAIRQAQHFTWNALNTARRLGMGKLVPNRQPQNPDG
jgi:hydroxymethylpyrimidine/phosphomethylpyrimidine kinase